MTTPPPEDAWQAEMTAAAELAQTGDLAGAAEAFRALVLTDVPATARSMACCNIAMLLRQTGQDDEALAWYDEAARHDPEVGILNALSDKAALLHASGRSAEASVELERLLELPQLAGESRTTVEHNLALVRGQA